MALQRAREHGIEAAPALGEIAAKRLALARAQFAQLVVVAGAERSLAVANECQVTHQGIVRCRPAVPASPL